MAKVIITPNYAKMSVTLGLTLPGPKGLTGAGLEFDWDDTSLGVRVEGQEDYQYRDLRGPKGETGAGLEFDWDGTSLGVRTEGQDDYQYQDLRGPEGPKGETGASLEFDWDDTSLGVRVEGQDDYQYQDLKGPKGETGAVPNLKVGTVQTLPAGSSATVTRRSGSPDTEPIFDFGIPKGLTGATGASLEFDWDNTSLGIRAEGQDEYQYQDLRGPKGDKPAHQWSGTSLRFENPDGTWGSLVNLKGQDGTGAGDMLKSEYDTNDDGKVDAADNADKLGNVAASLYALKSDVDTVQDALDSHKAESASTSAKGHVQLSTSTASTSTSTAATSSAVKAAMDKANSSTDAIEAHEAETSVHGSTSAATANRIIMRDSAGRAKVTAPSASDDIARKDTVDNHAGVTSAISTLGHVYEAEFTATITAASWSGTTPPYSNAVTVSGITSSHNPIIDVTMSGTYSTDQQRCEQWGNIYRAVTSSNTITFYAHEKPTIGLPIRVKVVM